MEALLRPLLARKREHGVATGFFPATKGDRKSYLLTQAPVKAANIILNDPDAVVAIVPDLYPRNKGFEHETAAQLRKGLSCQFAQALEARAGTRADERWLSRFHPFCFKHDIEALLLAAEDSLRSRLRARGLDRTWITPVEDQDHGTPPKRIVKALLRQHGRNYIETVHVPLILEGADYREIARLCPQCFAPFVAFLEELE